MNKKISRLAATSMMMMMMSMGITAMASGLESPSGLNNPSGLDTPVKYSGQGQQVWEVTVPSLLRPTDSGEVRLEGTWDSTKTAKITVPETFVMTNDIDGGTKTIDIDFEDIEEVGNNTLHIEVVKKI